MPRKFDHIDLRVPNMDAARDFYLGLLPELGFTCDATVKDWLQFEAEGDGPAEFFGVTEDRDFVPNKNRVAFWAESDDQVDHIASSLAALGARVIEGPGYESSDYYAVFFEDPFGNRFEVVHRAKRFDQRPS